MFCLFCNQCLHFICSWSYGVVLYEIFTVGKLLFLLINDNNGLRRGSFLCNRFWRRSLFEFLYFQAVLRIREWMARKLLAYFNKNTGCQSHSTWMTNCNSISTLLNHSLKLYPICGCICFSVQTVVTIDITRGDDQL